MAVSLLLAGWLAGALQAQVVPAYQPPLPPGLAPLAQPGVPVRTMHFSRGAVQEAQGEKKPDAPPGVLIYPYEKEGVVQVGGVRRPGEEEVDFVIQTEMPGLDAIYGRRDSEKQFRDRIRMEVNRRPGATRAFFPEDQVLTRDVYNGRAFARMCLRVEPAYVSHGRLYFEQPNFERQNWDLGIIGPPVSLLAFYYDTAMLPYHVWTRPTQRDDTSAGKCLPGDSTPLLLYPEEWSITGLMGLGATYTLGAFIFP